MNLDLLKQMREKFWMIYNMWKLIIDLRLNKKTTKIKR